MNRDEIAARLKAATPGPWRAKQMNHAEDAPWFFVLDAQGRGPVVETVIAQTKYLVTPEAEQRADVEFIAHAPTDIAWLLERADALAGALDDFTGFFAGEDLESPQYDSWMRAETVLAAYRGTR